jgi:hypothetical protein
MGIANRILIAIGMKEPISTKVISEKQNGIVKVHGEIWAGDYGLTFKSAKEARDFANLLTSAYNNVMALASEMEDIQ